MSKQFLATITDLTDSQNPSEEVELDIEEISISDLHLLAEGATFYWSIGYRDTPGGQRDRVSSFRFVRYPILRETDIQQIVTAADNLATLLES